MVSAMSMTYDHPLAPKVPTCFKVLSESNSTLHKIISSFLSLRAHLYLLIVLINELSYVLFHPSKFYSLH